MAYLYRELLARFFIPIYDYTVTEAVRANETTLDVTLAPSNRSLTFSPGQFIVLAFGGPFGWQRHPFTIASAPAEPQLQVTIKSAGDYARELHDGLKAGLPAKVVGPFGEFDYRHGGKMQI